ncbi:hypothetical protein AALA52_06670 [Lactococcus ileimucosae]|uniref:Uncharacterized protein n=1 Tax=Lactococcus ileimucosae TaxID=2941329 RepID=A0ABV4D2Z9_9LACT
MKNWTQLVQARIIEITGWNQEKAQIQAQHIISSIQGNHILLKLTQDWAVFERGIDKLRKEIKSLA